MAARWTRSLLAGGMLAGGMLIMGATFWGCDSTSEDADATAGDAGGGGQDTTPTACTTEFQFDDWNIETERRMVLACSPYEPDRSVEIRGGGRLVVDPGVEVRFQSGDWLRVGGGSEGTLVAEGSATQPIVFASSEATPVAGSWLGLRFESQAGAGTILRNVRVSHGGQALVGTRGCLTINSEQPERFVIEDSTFDQCAQSGISADRPGFSFESLARNTFRDSDAGMWLHANAVASAAPEQAYDQTPNNRIKGGDVERTGTWGRQDVPWLAEGSVEVRGDSSPLLTIAAGAVVRFDGGSWLRVGGGSPGGLIMAGTAQDPVVLESQDQGGGPGSWLGIRLGDQTTSDTQLRGAIVRQAGESSVGQRGCVTIDSSAPDRVTIEGSRFEQCAQAAVTAERDGFRFVSFADNEFVSCDAGLRLHPGAVGSVDEGQTYEDTQGNLVTGGDVAQSATWERQPVPWELEASVDVRSDAGPVLTVAAGATLRFPTNTWLRVGSGTPGALVAAGTEAAPVIFEARDTAGGPGSWLGLNLGSAALTGTSLANAIVRQAGQDALGQKGGVTVLGPGDNVSITNTTFEQNLAFDVWFDCDDPPLLEGNSYDAGIPECPES